MSFKKLVEVVQYKIAVRFVQLLSLISFSLISNAQNTPYDVAKVIPPSPTAAALGAYGNIEMSYYSGNPSISIPLYDIKTTSHSTSLSLSYDASGTKVSQDASWVGLGWSLNAGGVITRTVRGIDDFGSNGYYSSMGIPAETSPLLAENQSYFREMSLNRNDGDADIINYNIGPYSGKFVLGKSADGSKVYMDERNNLNVKYTASSWIITDSKGYKFYLGKQERASDYSFTSLTGDELSDNAPLSAYKKSVEPDVITAWYLDSISSPSKETIKFIYETGRKSLSLVSKSEEKHNLINTIINCGTNIPSFQNFLERRSAFKQEISNVNLTKIIFKGGTVDFILSDREDIEYTGTLKPAKLSEIVIKNLSGTQIKKYKFYYSYFLSASPDGRLKLDQIRELSSRDISKRPYQFSYFEANNVPSKYSKSIDHWNYYNGKYNLSILPGEIIESKAFSGGDRQPDSVAIYPKKGVLSMITYPTGGSTSFEFELNEYSNMSGSDAFTYTPTGVQVNARPTDENSNRSKTFTIKQGDTVNVNISYGYSKHDVNANSIKNIQVIFAYLYGPNNVQLASWSNWACPSNTEDPTCGMDNGVMKMQEMILTPGNYRLEVRYIQGYSTTLDIRWNAKTPITRLKGAGLRVKSIINSDNGKTTLVRKFDYTSDGKTTGLLISQPKYSYVYSVGGGSTNGNCSIIVNYLGRVSGSIYLPGLLSKGTIVGYSKVTEMLGANGEGGRTEYFYNNSVDMLNSLPFLPSISSPYNGKLATTLTYNSSGRLVKKSNYEYLTKETEYLKGVRIYNPTMSQDPTQNTFFVKYYDNVSYWIVLSSESQNDYLNGLPTLITKTNYFFNNAIHRNISRKEVSTSGSGIFKTEYFYPHDLKLSGTAEEARLDLIANWRISSLLQTNEIRGDNVIITKTEYLKNGLTLPHKVLSNTGPIGAFETRVQNHKYDVHGNLLSTSLNKGPIVSYKWGYQNSYPVAEIRNALPTEFYHENFEESVNFSEPNLISLDYSRSHTGKYSAKITNFGPGEKYTSLPNMIQLNSTTLTRYTFSGWVYSDGPSAEIFMFLGRAGESNCCAFERIQSDLAGKWVYLEKEVEVPAGVSELFLRIDNNGAGNVWFDDLKIHPSNAQMTTYTNDPLVGITSATDAKGLSMIYEYDDFQRLMNVKDYQGNIVKHYKYFTGTSIP